MHYSTTLSCAQAWANQGKTEDWIHTYLLGDGHNKPFSDGLKLMDRIYLAPALMPLSLFHRCCGPEEGMTYPVPVEAWERHVNKMMQAIQRDPDMPPLIAHYRIPEGKAEGIFELNDGNHRWEAYARLGITEAYVIMWFTHQHEYQQFMGKYGSYIK